MGEVRREFTQELIGLGVGYQELLRYSTLAGMERNSEQARPARLPLERNTEEVGN
jgi:hypothetical protein